MLSVKESISLLMFGIIAKLVTHVNLDALPSSSWTVRDE